MLGLLSRFIIKLDFEITVDVTYTSKCTSFIRGNGKDMTAKGVSTDICYNIARSRSQHIALESFAKSLNVSVDDLLGNSHLVVNTIFMEKDKILLDTHQMCNNRSDSLHDELNRSVNAERMLDDHPANVWMFDLNNEHLIDELVANLNSMELSDEDDVDDRRKLSSYEKIRLDQELDEYMRFRCSSKVHV